MEPLLEKVSSLFVNDVEEEVNPWEKPGAGSL